MPSLLKKAFAVSLEKERSQRSIMRRFYIAIGGYAFAFVGVVVPGYLMGFARDLSMLQILLYLVVPLLLINACFFIVFLTGLNRFFRDPGLTFWQQLAGLILATVICYHTAAEIRGACLILYIHIFYFGTFQGRYRDFFYPLVVTVILYAGMIVLLHYRHPEALDIPTEIMRFLILLTALLWLMWMGRYLARLRTYIQHLAIRDELTGAYNRRQLFSLLEREKSRVDRAGGVFTVCMMDIDDFKLVNDTYGHQAGDDVLREFTRVLQQNIRREDYLGRYGGEEFLVVLTNHKCHDPDDESVQRLRRVTENISFQETTEIPGITVSIGVSTYQAPESIDMLIARADQALYEAKRKGKNRVELSREHHAGQAYPDGFYDQAADD
ncbi:MAG: GGDEF domain-containing protein [Desulfosudaceae bacterium]